MTIELPASMRRSGSGNNQTREWQKEYVEGGSHYLIKLTARHDDRCKNGHNTFSMTTDIYRWIGNVSHTGKNRGHWRDHGGCGSREDIATHFPELAPYMKWHLCSNDGPLHYIANTLFQAGDKDAWGRRKGEPYSFQLCALFGESPIRHNLGPTFMKWLREASEKTTEFEIAEIQHGKNETGASYNFAPKYTFKGYREEEIKWHQCPFDTMDKATEWADALATCQIIWEERPTAWGEGKEPELEAARRSAIWPDATLEQLRDKAALEARLPALLGEFKGAVESLGFVY